MTTTNPTGDQINEAILNELQNIRKEVSGMRTELASFKAEMSKFLGMQLLKRRSSSFGADPFLDEIHPTNIPYQVRRRNTDSTIKYRMNKKPVTVSEPSSPPSPPAELYVECEGDN